MGRYNFGIFFIKTVKWLDDEISVKKIEEYLQITSPFLDRFNDYLQVYAKIDKNNEILLTDDSYIINNLQDSGIDITSPKRKQLLDSFLRKYRISLKNMPAKKS